MNTKKTTSNSDVYPDTIAPDHIDATISNSVNKKSNGNGKSKHKAVPNYSNTDLGQELNGRELLRVLSEVKNGNFNVRMPIDLLGIDGKICDTLNDIIYLNEKLMEELTVAGKTIGTQGKLNHRVELPFAKGSWNTGVDSINNLISDLVHPTVEIAHVIGSVAKGNLSQEMPLQIGDHVLQGEFA